MEISGVAGHPAVAIFRDPVVGGSVPDLDAAGRAEAQRAAQALREVPAHGRPGERSAALRQAAVAVAELVAALSAKVPSLVGESVPAESTSQSFFRVREMELSDHQAALQGALVVHRGLRDLCEAPLSGSDLALEVAGMRRAVLDLTGAPDDDRGRPASPRTQMPVPVAEPLEQVWRVRWIIGHQVHVLFNMGAATAVTDAAHHLRHGRSAAALRRLGHATVYVRGFPAAMAHASTMPADFYMQVVRDTMAPPSVDRPLSGRQHHGYKVFRAAMKDLLAVLPEHYEQLAGRDPALAAARNALLEADLVDGERHVTLAYSMVQLRRSIAQLPQGPDNAVAELRLIRHRRAAQYAPLLRFGDHYVAGAVAALRRG